VVAPEHPDPNIKAFLMVLQRLLVLALPVVNITDAVVRRRHVRVLVANRCSATKILCVRSQVHKILCTEKGHFEGYLVDILFSSSFIQKCT
jgi:hypothetical protein